jgi:hypothetical protein
MVVGPGWITLSVARRRRQAGPGHALSASKTASPLVADGAPIAEDWLNLIKINATAANIEQPPVASASRVGSASQVRLVTPEMPALQLARLSIQLPVALRPAQKPCRN